MTKRYITIPPSVTLFDLDGNPVLDSANAPVLMKFTDFVKNRTTDGAFAATMASVLSAVDIRVALAGRTTGDVLEIDEDAWSLLATSVRTPSSPWNLAVATSLTSFMKAIVNASTSPV